METKLFRYRSSSKHSVESALKGKMFFTCPLELNDPFEFYIKYNIDKVYDLIQKDTKAKRIVSKLLYRFSINFAEIGGPISKPKTTEECLKMFDDPKRLVQTKQWLKNEIERRIIDFKESFGIISLTSNPKEPVMWSHYSSDSSGFLEIYDKDLFLWNFESYLRSIQLNYTREQMMVLGAFPIQYIDSFPERNNFIKKLLLYPSKKVGNIGIDFIDNEETAKEVLDISISKLSAWDYEDEIRLILPYDVYNIKRNKTYSGTVIHNHFFECSLSDPEKIVLGYKGDIELEFALKYHCKKKKIKYEKSNASFDFSIE